VFKGRISGFTMGTGSTLVLLPPENATGNFVGGSTIAGSDRPREL
jgi:multidrug resistance efflux pump